jgi:hypothetical protein
MERLTNIPEARIEELRARFAEELPSDEEALDEKDRQDRVVVAYYLDDKNIWHPTSLKRDDDVLVNQLKARVIGPGKGREYFLAYVNHEQFGEMIIPFSVLGVRERAPADENEEPMPVVPGHNAPPSLSILRAGVYQRIDRQTDNIITQGFTYNDKRFSLSLEAQTRYNAVYSASQADDLVESIQMNTLDDEDYIILADKEEVRQFCLTALATIKAVVDAGSAQKNRARDMTSADELLSFKDTR